MPDMPEWVVRFREVSVDALEDAPLPSSISAPTRGVDASKDPFTSPLNARDLGEIRGYLEQYWQWPLGSEYDRAHRIEKNFPLWGKPFCKAPRCRQNSKRLHRN